MTDDKMIRILARRKEVLEGRRGERARSKEIIKLLGIPLHQDNYIDPVELCDILLSEDKLKELISKLRNKAFW